jgi:hypothetical protein
VTEEVRMSFEELDEGPGGHRVATRDGNRGWQVLKCGLLAVLVALTAVEAGAHNLGESYLYLQVYGDRVTGRFEVALTDLNAAFQTAGTDREITRENLDEHIPFLQEYYLEHVEIEDASGPLPIRFGPHGFTEDRGGNVLLPFEFVEVGRVPDVLTFDYSVLLDEQPGHRGFLLVEHNWATGTFANEAGISLVFGPSSRRQDFDVTTGGRLKGFLGVVRLGIDHIWMGADHVLFLLALLLPAVLRREDGQWKKIERFTPALINVLKIVTAFTVAHSVTLSLAALGLIHLPSRLVESAIAFSIAAAAVDIIVPIFHQRIWVVVFVFGLFHGFGFAGALEEMGILSEHLGLTLFGFNLGVEIGQVVIVALVFPVLYLLRNLKLYRSVGVQVAAVGMIVIASGWLYERVFDVNVPVKATLQAIARTVTP